MADANGDVKQYFSELEGSAKQVVDTLNDINKHLTDLGYGPIGTGEEQKLESYAQNQPEETYLFRRIEALVTVSNNLSVKIVINAQNYYGRWKIES